MIISRDLQIIKECILKSDENIDDTGLWQAYLRIVEYIKNTEMANQGTDRKEGKSKLTPKDITPQEGNMI